MSGHTVVLPNKQMQLIINQTNEQSNPIRKYSDSVAYALYFKEALRSTF